MQFNSWLTQCTDLWPISGAYQQYKNIFILLVPFLWQVKSSVVRQSCILNKQGCIHCIATKWVFKNTCTTNSIMFFFVALSLSDIPLISLSSGVCLYYIGQWVNKSMTDWLPCQLIYKTTNWLANQLNHQLVNGPTHIKWPIAVCKYLPDEVVS